MLYMKVYWQIGPTRLICVEGLDGLDRVNSGGKLMNGQKKRKSQRWSSAVRGRLTLTMLFVLMIYRTSMKKFVRNVDEEY